MHQYIFVFVLFCSLSLIAQNRTGKDYAIFFAVDDYQATRSFKDLNNPVRDAEALAKELREMYGFTTKVYANYSKQGIYTTLQNWQSRRFASDGQLFVFFSGHGDFDEFEKKGYFIPKDAVKIDLTTLGNIVTQIPCPHILLAIDACYAGTIDQAIAFKGRPTTRRPGETPQSERDRIISRQLRNPSRLLITSGGKERTPDGKEHSPFSAAILSGLRAAYAHGDGLFLYKDLLGKLERVSPRPYEGKLEGHEEGGFVFVAEDMTEPPPPNGHEMVRVEGGSYIMGCKDGRDTDCYSDEKPAHRVSVPSFSIGKYEVTNEQFAAFLNARGNKEEGGTTWYQEKEENGYGHILKQNGRYVAENGYAMHPVMEVSWYGAVAYCKWLSEISGKNYRLPTEAEWEFAARGGNRSKSYQYAGSNKLDEVAWYGENSGGETHPVGKKRANELSLYDMSGNVWEWCEDTWHTNYENVPIDGSVWLGGDSALRVLRGGSWDYVSWNTRVSYRDGSNAFIRVSYYGFRIAQD